MEVEVIYKQGNIADDEAEVLINTVNCVGVMGKGVAKLFKEKFPAMYRKYKELCNDNQIKIGKMSVFIFTRNDKTQHIVNFPTKVHWRNPSTLEMVELGLKDLSELLVKIKPQTMAMPMPGCGNGGLNWEDVKPLVYNHLVNSRKLLKGKKLTIYIYIPPGHNLKDS